MKKLCFIIMMTASAVFFSCSKEQSSIETGSELKQRTFIVSTPETRTTLNDHSILWGANDKIRIIGYSAPAAEGEEASSEQAVFEITSGVGEKTAAFSGTIGDYDSYYAIYPSEKEINPSKLPSLLELKSGMDLTAQSAVENGYDPSYAIMTAKLDENGKLVFHHGVAYIKIQVAEEGVTAVKVSFANNATGSRPAYNTNDGTVSTVNGGTNQVQVNGSFVKGSSYYLIAPARASNPGKVTVSFVKNGFTQSVSTNSLEKKRLANGEIYDLGCPPISFTPVISVTAPAKLEYDATSGSFTYSIANVPDGAVASAEITSGTWISNVTVSGNTVSFDCEKNDATDAEERSAVITLSYDGADSVPVTITQKAAESPAENHVHVFYYNSDSDAINLTDGESGSYFAATGKTDLDGDYAISEWTIGDYTSTKGVKMNSSGSIVFTTSATLTSTVQFYFIRRKSADTSAKIQLVPATGTAMVFDSPYDAYADSGVIALEKGMAYTIKQASKEQAVLLVVVHETE